MNAHAAESPASGDLAPAAAQAPAVYERPQATAPVAAQGDDPFLAMIERAARDPAVQIEKMERLFELMERTRASRARQAFSEAFAQLQVDLPSIDRKGRIVVFSKKDREKPGGPAPEDTPQQVTPYATLDDILQAIRGPMAQHGFSIRFEHAIVPPGSPEGRIETTAIIMHRDGHSERATTPPLMHDSSGSKNAVQAVGSALKYGRRYSLMAALPIVSHAPQDADDDGKAAGGKPAGVITDEQVEIIRELIAKTKANEAALLGLYKAPSIEAIKAGDFDRLIKQLEKKLANKAKEVFA